ncbi:PoNe immunity protein domain-containing protein [Neorhizobium sp. DT-125]|uniref:PoNe immunity protein domain-containing protein n=1 Tax=Neorhizobium sp. DT-125 TaxID=3396163 RepID=UPI003F1E136F
MKHQIKSQGYFTTYLAVNAELAEELAFSADDPRLDPHKRLGFAWDLFRTSCQNAVAGFSAHRAHAEVLDLVHSALDALSMILRLNRLFGGRPGDRRLQGATIDELCRILAWCILFEVPRHKCTLVLEFLAHAPLQGLFCDALVDALAGYLGRRPHDPSRRLLWPDPYSSLYRCFIVEGEDRALQLGAFVQRWYTAKSDAHWHENHLSKYDEYFGYWCFEAAAVARLLDIPDDHLKDHPNYPYDARHGMTTPVRPGAIMRA